MDWTFPVGDAVATTPAWPVAAGVVGLLLAVVAAVLAFLQPLPGSDRRWPWVLLPVGLLLLVFQGALPVLAAFGTAAHLDALQGFQGATVFGTVVGVGVVVGWSTVLVLLVGLVLALVRAPRPAPSRERSLAAFATAAGALVLGQVPVAAAAWLCSLGDLPEITATEPVQVHVGREVVPAVSLQGKGTESWRVRVPGFSAPAPGAYTVRVSAGRFLATVARSVAVEVGWPEGDPVLPLRPGRSWTFQEVRDVRHQFLWFFPAREHTEGPVTEIVVGAEETGGPLQAYGVRIRNGTDEREVRVWPWNGAWQTEGGVFFRAFPGEPGEPGPDGQPLVPCALAVFEDSTCQCLAHPAGQARVPGPVRCRWTGGDAAGLRMLGTLTLAAMTAGLFIVDPDPQVRWELVGSGP